MSRKFPSKSSSNSPDLSKRALGQYGEGLAARWYELHGFEIVERNWRCRAGEIDLICRNGQTIVFSEVKTRVNAAYGFPVEAVTATKQARIRKLAMLYLADSDHGFIPEIRFDIASICGRDVEVIEGAF